MLTQKLVIDARPGPKPYYLHDHDRLSLEVKITGTKVWRFQYRYGKKRNKVIFGRYPDVSLAEARSLAAEARLLLERGIEPATRFRQWTKSPVGTIKVGGVTSASSLFRDVVDEFYDKRRDVLTEKYILRIKYLLNAHLYSSIGDKYVSAIQPLDILHALQVVEKRSPDIAKRLLIWTDQVMRYAIATQRLINNPASSLKGALRPAVKKHRPAITDATGFGQLLQTISALDNATSARVGLKLMPLLFVRPGELRQARWKEFDVEAILAGKPSVWEIPAERMKMRSDHVVPLSRQATALFRAQHKQTGEGELVFTYRGGKVISDSAMNVVLKSQGYSGDIMTVHGFRASARTLLDEELGFSEALIEHQLAHTVRDPLGRAYNRTKHLKQRMEMMQAWADYLDTLRGARRPENEVVDQEDAREG